MHIKHYHETSLNRRYLTRDILEPDREFNRRGRGGTRRRIKLLRSSRTLRLFLWLFNFSGWTLIMVKKINHRGHGGHRELLFSLCPLCSLWFFQNPFQKIIKSLLFFLPERTGSQSGDQLTYLSSYDFGKNR